MIRKELFILLAVCFLCCSCSGISDGKADNTNVKSDTDVTDNVKEVTALANLYKYSVDVDTGKEKFGMLLKENFVYTGEELLIGAGMYINNEMTEEENIPVLCMLLLDGNPIPFSVNGNESSVLQKDVLENGVEKKVKLGFMPYGVSDNDKSLMFIAVPFFDKANIQIYENDVLCCMKKIESECGDLEWNGINNECEYNYIDDISMIKQKVFEKTDISNGWDEYVVNYIYKDDNGDYYFTADYQNGKYKTMILCDGNLYHGFDGGESFEWEGGTGYIHKKINTDSLALGKHIMSVITIEDNDNYYSVKKSLNTEVEISG